MNSYSGAAFGPAKKKRPAAREPPLPPPTHAGEDYSLYASRAGLPEARQTATLPREWGEG